MGAERRLTSRHRSFARVIIVFDSCMGYVADVGPDGFRGVFLSNPVLVPGARIKLRMAFSELGILPFALEVFVRWSDFDMGAIEAGFQLCEDLSAEARGYFETIRDYYARNPGETT